MGLLDKVFGKKNKYEVKEEDVKAGLDATNKIIDMYNEALDNSRWGDQIKIGKELAKLYKTFYDKENECEVYRGISSAYLKLGEPNKAIENQENILKIAKDTGDKALEDGCYYNLYIIYDEYVDDPKKAREYMRKLEKSLKNSRK